MLPETWGQVVGGYGISNFDGAVHLAELVGDGLNARELHARYRSESDALILQQPVLPGVVDYLDDARRWDCVWPWHPVRRIIGWIRILPALGLLTVSMPSSAATMSPRGHQAPSRPVFEGVGCIGR
jgi:hypothetical protein